MPDMTIDQLPPAPARGRGPRRLDRADARPGAHHPLPAGRPDVMVQARTGSGKTGAFLLPMLERLDPQRNTTARP